MRSSQWVWLLCALCAVGCSQKDPAGDGGPSDNDPDGGSNVEDDYYPMVAGSTLTYRHDGNPSWDDRTQVSDAQYQGKSAWITEGSPDDKGESSKNTITQDGTRIYRAFKEDFRAGSLTGTVEYVPGFIRFDRAWADKDDGFSENIKYTRIEKTAMGSVVAEDEREHTYTVEKARESVTVPAGTFDDCVRVRRVRVRGNPANATDDDDKVFWFCPGIGKVKELSEIGGGTEELVSCDIPGGLCP